MENKKVLTSLLGKAKLSSLRLLSKFGQRMKSLQSKNFLELFVTSTVSGMVIGASCALAKHASPQGVAICTVIGAALAQNALIGTLYGGEGLGIVADKKISEAQITEIPVEQ